jgi:two-component system, sensor histidine kinase YesM
LKKPPVSFRIRNKIFFAFLAVVILPLVMATIWYYLRVEQMTYNNMVVSLRNSLMQVHDNMTDMMKNISVARYVLIMNQGGMATLDEYVQHYSNDENTTYTYNYLSAVQIENTDFLLNNVLNSYLPDGSRITLYNFTNNAISIPRRSEGKVTLAKLTGDPYYKQLMAMDVGSPSIWAVSQGDYASDDANRYVSYMQLLRQPNVRNQFFFAVSVPESYISSHILSNGLAQGSSMLLVSQSGEVLAYAGEKTPAALISSYVQSHAEALEKDLTTPEKVGEDIVLAANLPYDDWKLLLIVPQSGILLQINQARTQYMVILLLSFLTFVVVIYLLLRRITGPIEKLIGYIGEAERGRLDVEFDVKSRDEIGLLAKSFQNMLRQIQVLMRQKVLEEKQRNEYKYQALQAQINPHFLLNTLNGIKWLAVLDNNNTVAGLIASLGRLMEMSLFRGQEDIPFQEELKNVQSYIDLQKSRYDNMFSVTYDVDEEINQCACPRLLLQPIVENSIIHGIASANKKCELKISGRLMNEREAVCISVSDDGVGIPQERMAELLATGRNKETVFKGIGLSNVDERIKLRYGTDYGLTIDSQPGCGTSVTLLIPFILWEALVYDKGDDS